MLFSVCNGGPQGSPGQRGRVRRASSCLSAFRYVIDLVKGGVCCLMLVVVVVVCMHDDFLYMFAFCLSVCLSSISFFFLSH